MKTYLSDTGWRKSSRSSGNGQCVEIRFAGATVQIRDSKYLRVSTNDPALQPIISLPAARWHEFLDAARKGNAVVDSSLPAVERRVDGSVAIKADGITLTYTPPEWEAFTAGVLAGEFATP